MSSEPRKETLKTSNNLLVMPSFLSLWVAGSFSSLSLSMYMLIEEWFVVSQLKLPNMLGIVAMFTLLPRVILMFVGGSLADRVSRKRILFLSDFTRGLLVSFMALLFFIGRLNLFPLLAFSFIFGILDALYWPANSSLLPSIVSKDNLIRANSLIQSTNNIFMIAGPAIGAVMIRFFGYQAGFVFIACLLFAGSLINLKIKEPAPNAAPSNRTSILKDFTQTISYIKTEPYLMTSMGTSFVINFFFSGPINVGIPILVKLYYHGTPITLSYMEGTLSAGMVIGAMLMGAINLKRKRAVANLIMIAGMDVFAILLSQTSAVWEGLIYIAFLGLILSASNVNGPSVSQSIINPEYMGRVQSLQSATGMGLTPLSFAICSLLLSNGVQFPLILLVASSIGLCFVIFVLIKVRSLWSID